jgi:ComF family protein
MSLITRSKEYVKSFLDLVYPESCYTCEVPLLEAESFICVFCQFNLFIENQQRQKKKALLSKFSEQPVDDIFVLMRYKKGGDSQELIGKIKYHAETSLGFYLGQKLGEVLNSSGQMNDLDFIIPVPLHSKKIRKRGFNQSEVIARGISEVIDKPVLNNVLLKEVDNSTQTKRGRLSRWKNTDLVYSLKLVGSQLDGKNVLLVDDVLTSGATLTNCLKQLSITGVAKKYVAVLASADR